MTNTLARPARAPDAAGVAARPDRKAAILLAAERLFSEHGYHAVSIRQIAAEAGVPLALVGYYYGAKHELFHAIFTHWQPTIDQRLALLREALAGDAPPPLRRVVQAFVEPVLRLRASSEGEYYATLVARELQYRTPETARALADTFDPMAHAFIDALHQLRPHWPRARASWAYQFAIGALLHHLADHRVERLSQGHNRANDPAAGPLLIDFITAGLEAALPASPTSTTQES
ncbi:MAG: TetR/AcrR family transcriptional regulator [Burkholderiaceae bacterium]